MTKMFTLQDERKRALSQVYIALYSTEELGAQAVLSSTMRARYGILSDRRMAQAVRRTAPQLDDRQVALATEAILATTARWLRTWADRGCPPESGVTFTLPDYPITWSIWLPTEF